MATPPIAPDPVRAMMARQLIQRMAQGGGATDQSMGQQLGGQFAQLQGADPQFMLKALNQIKVMMVPLYGRAAFAVPEVSRHIATAQKSIDAAIKAAEQGAATQQSVRPPIVNNAAMPNPVQGPGGGEPIGQQGGGPPGGGGIAGLP